MYYDVFTVLPPPIGHADSHWRLGNELRAIGRTDDAIMQYRQALRFDPHSSSFHASLADALKAQGKSDEAAAEYREAAQGRQQPRNPRESREQSEQPRTE